MCLASFRRLGLSSGVRCAAGFHRVSCSLAGRTMASSAVGRIAVTRRLPGPQQEELLRRVQERGIQLLQNDSDEPVDRRQLEEWTQQGIDGLYCLLTDKIDQELIRQSGPRLEVVSTMSAGFNHIDVQACKSNGTAVGYTPDVLTDTTADLAVGLLLSTARRIPEAAQAVKDGKLHSNSAESDWIIIIGYGVLSRRVDHVEAGMDDGKGYPWFLCWNYWHGANRLCYSTKTERVQLQFLVHSHEKEAGDGKAVGEY
eukprot:gb/GECG01006543.1/.p1 GENE.gb/GECG01006543.1/~~gb/GECG01006543.1/.p1  ORF type:complete len:256 (+),score=23.34 gb/GECG01006543.1/:1-768(+)